jgi:hypothetical protein
VRAAHRRRCSLRGQQSYKHNVGEPVQWHSLGWVHEGSEFVKGQPEDTNLDTYALLRKGDVPDVEVEFLPSTEAPVGLGEPATTPVAAAIGNAIFAAGENALIVAVV